jgi:hypothetical protein
MSSTARFSSLRPRRVLAFAVAASGAFALVVACSSPNPGVDLSGRDAGPPGTTLTGDAASFPYAVKAAVSGAADTHCGATVQTTSTASCHPDAAGLDASGATDYGDTMFGSSGSDDDCKYDVSWQSTPIAVGQPVWFQLTLKNKSDGSPATGAAPLVETFRLATNDPGPSSNANQAPYEVAPGVYVIGPVAFDQSNASGEAGASSTPPYWTARFHFDEDCSDLLPDSPHGHAAFYLQVPSP